MNAVNTTRAEIAAMIAATSIHFTAEAELQEKLGALLTERGVTFEREVRISPKDRIDFLLPEGLGIEIKVKGSPADVLRQLHRYMQVPSIASLILVTTQARHLDLPAKLNGKPLAICFISFARGI